MLVSLNFILRAARDHWKILNWGVIHPDVDSPGMERLLVQWFSIRIRTHWNHLRSFWKLLMPRDCWFGIGPRLSVWLKHPECLLCAVIGSSSNLETGLEVSKIQGCWNISAKVMVVWIAGAMKRTKIKLPTKSYLESQINRT